MNGKLKPVLATSSLCAPARNGKPALRAFVVDFWQLLIVAFYEGQHDMIPYIPLFLGLFIIVYAN
jgi:hypothetical protein